MKYILLTIIFGFGIACAQDTQEGIGEQKSISQNSYTITPPKKIGIRESNDLLVYAKVGQEIDSSCLSSLNSASRSKHLGWSQLVNGANKQADKDESPAVFSQNGVMPMKYSFCAPKTASKPTAKSRAHTHGFELPIRFQF